MLNNAMLVGRIATDLKGNESEIVISVTRNFKNKKGEYETDLIPCVLFGQVAQKTAEYCKKGDVVGIKGRLQGNGETIILIAERVTFLSSAKTKEEE